MRLPHILKTRLALPWRGLSALFGRNHRRARILTAIILVAHLAGLLTSIRAVMDTRTSQGAIAWVVSLNTMPYVAVPAYWVFGRSKFEGYVIARRKGIDATSSVAGQAIKALHDRKLVANPGRDKPMLVEKLAKLPFTTGNDAKLLIDGDETFQSIFDGIARAEKYVLVQFYIIRDDEVGQELKSRLIARAKAGVRCLVLYDEIGSSLPDSYTGELAAAGVAILPFNSTKGSANRFQLNFRNHRKIVIVDGREGWVGGLNIGKEYKGLDPKIGYFRDTHLWVAGPLVQSLQVSFVEDWQWASGEIPKDLVWDAEPAMTGVSRNALCLPSGPADRLETCTLFFLNAINLSRERLWIASPYFVPDEQFISALQLAALRGVDVRILIPENADNKLVELSAWSYLDTLEQSGIQVFRYTKGFMHHKVMVVDDDYCTVGTANFDNRSFRLNFEVTVAFEDKDFTSKVADMLTEDFSHSRAMKSPELAGKSFWFRFAVKAARLTAPVQ